MNGSNEITRHADVSPDGVYRYTLTRRWTAGPTLAFVMLNPSVADDRIDDPTIRRCMGFARHEGLAGIHVVNLFAARATNPDALAVVDDPVGPHNAWHLRMLLLDRRSQALPVVAAWGAHKGIADRVAIVRHLVDGVDWRCLGTTRSGAPRHPLYVRANQPLEVWS